MPLTGPAPAAGFELALGGLSGGDPVQLAQVGHQNCFGTASVPVMVLGPSGPVHVLDDRVLGADLDLSVTARAAVELAGDAADQPGLVAFVGESAKAPALAGQPRVLAHRRFDNQAK